MRISSFLAVAQWFINTGTNTHKTYHPEDPHNFRLDLRVGEMTKVLLDQCRREEDGDACTYTRDGHDGVMEASHGLCV